MATDTVEASGDPAGGVQWDGSSVAVQATDADRPVWQGETRGTNFDRSSGQHLYSPEPATFWKFLNHTGGTIVASVKPDDLTNPKRILTTRESGNGIYFDINNNDLRFGSEAGGSPANRAASGVISAGVYQQVAAAFDPTTMKFYVDGVLVRDTSQTNFGDVDPEGTAHFGSEIGTGGNYFDGDIEYIAVYDRVLTQSEIQSIEVK
ncbi:MAG: LamG domain-containing protein [Trueperaceae bacterium]|nr:LamG domain-containing protein [Trueperaceae bacterium]